ncbi:MAG: iron-containing alcohol dehydrogenase [Provencibacterium sp.]|nr:iron-containing alcohol dehydrogenase [Provencibacterium sp.]
MNDFIYYTPTKVYFGRGCENGVGKAVKEQGAKKVLVHFGGGSVRRSGLLGRLEASLGKEGIAYVELGGVEPNPKIGLIREGIALCKKEGVDFILAVGGGSVIDSAKSIGLGLAHGCDDPWEMISTQTMPTAGFPVGVVLTIAAAGSEMSNSHVVTNPDGNWKRPLNHDWLRPVFAFENPELTYTVSKYQTGCGIVDIMMHTLERYCVPGEDNELTDRISEGLLTAVKNAGEVAVEKPDDYEARATLMWASSVSHNGLTGCGKLTTFPAHKIEHEVSGMFDKVSHGAGLAVIFPAWAKFVYKKDVRKFAQLAVRVFGVDMDFDHPEETARRGIESMIAYFRRIGMPTTIGELGVSPDAFEEMARKCAPLASYCELGVEEIVEIFKLAL